MGFGKAASGDLTLTYKHAGQTLTTSIADPDAIQTHKAAAGVPKADPKNKYQYGTVVPGEVIAYNVKVGDVLKAGAPMCVMESMKMEVKLSVPAELQGFKVKSLPRKGRTATLQGDLLTPGDLLIETEA
jgi:pyruvate carboxylase